MVRASRYLIGLASGAPDAAVQYAKSRRQFGRPLGRIPSIAFRLAASRARVHATRLLVRDTAARAGQGRAHRDGGTGALALAAEVSRTVTGEAVHVHGAFGMTLQVGMESIWLGAVPEPRRFSTRGRG
ncbi:hypothetical protein BFF78_24285 [Streptomyces fodineus]|uniref:Acyl-CoA dehydrogenase/oxidase C-terminal domain-containing protein n=1 Tax=Streptomyces fodineus TaxID=1904616 RepID=A0A1D7YDS4_9ACTN|nr:acyl-CoA dehydrogenase family protein [Streptomyces fodineus]AOR33763.1 hypothetical protein BFF78_24285 [Streptomyces fodineus]